MYNRCTVEIVLFFLDEMITFVFVFCESVCEALRASLASCSEDDLLVKTTHSNVEGRVCTCVYVCVNQTESQEKTSELPAGSAEFLSLSNSLSLASAI